MVCKIRALYLACRISQLLRRTCSKLWIALIIPTPALLGESTIHTILDPTGHDILPHAGQENYEATEWTVACRGRAQRRPIATHRLSFQPYSPSSALPPARATATVARTDLPTRQNPSARSRFIRELRIIGIVEQRSRREFVQREHVRKVASDTRHIRYQQREYHRSRY